MNRKKQEWNEETAVAEGFFVLEKQRNGMEQFVARWDFLELSGGKFKKLGWSTKIVRGLNRTAHKWRELQHHLIAIYGVPKET